MQAVHQLDMAPLNRFLKMPLVLDTAKHNSHTLHKIKSHHLRTILSLCIQGKQRYFKYEVSLQEALTASCYPNVSGLFFEI